MSPMPRRRVICGWCFPRGRRRSPHTRGVSTRAGRLTGGRRIVRTMPFRERLGISFSRGVVGLAGTTRGAGVHKGRSRQISRGRRVDAIGRPGQPGVILKDWCRQADELYRQWGDYAHVHRDMDLSEMLGVNLASTIESGTVLLLEVANPDPHSPIPIAFPADRN